MEGAQEGAQEGTQPPPPLPPRTLQLTDEELDPRQAQLAEALAAAQYESTGIPGMSIFVGRTICPLCFVVLLLEKLEGAAFSYFWMFLPLWVSDVLLTVIEIKKTRRMWAIGHRVNHIVRQSAEISYTIGFAFFKYNLAAKLDGISDASFFKVFAPVWIAYGCAFWIQCMLQSIYHQLRNPTFTCRRPIYRL